MTYHKKFTCHNLLDFSQILNQTMLVGSINPSMDVQNLHNLIMSCFGKTTLDCFLNQIYTLEIIIHLINMTIP